MPEWHEQKASVADNREDRAAQNREQNSSAPANAIQIANAGPQHDWQQCKAGPEVAVNSEVSGRESDIESVAHSDESGCPKSGRHNAANYAGSSWIEPTLWLQAPSDSRDAHALKSHEDARRWRNVALASDLLDGDASGFILDRTVDAAIDDDRLTGEIAGLRRAQISAEIADFVRLSHSLHRDRSGEALELFIECYA